jgi:hypothetical protein
MAMRISFRSGLAAVGILAATAVGAAAHAAADPAEFDNGYGNADATINALKAQGYNVVLNGAPVYPLTSCRVTGVEGLANSNTAAGGNRIDPTRFDTVYVDIYCKGG